MKTQPSEIKFLRQTMADCREPKAKHLRAAFESVFGDLESPYAQYAIDLTHLKDESLQAALKPYIDDTLYGRKELFGVQVSYQSDSNNLLESCTVTLKPSIKVSGYKQQLELYRDLVDLIDSLLFLGSEITPGGLEDYAQVHLGIFA